MDFLGLGKRIWRISKEEGQNLWKEIGIEWGEIKPHLRNIRDNLRTRSRDLRFRLSYDFQRWFEREFQLHGGNWASLFGRDPEVERAYELLQLPYGTELQAVKDQWLSFLKKHHPDRHMRDSKQESIATFKSQHYTAAYHQIKKAFRENRI